MGKECNPQPNATQPVPNCLFCQICQVRQVERRIPETSPGQPERHLAPWPSKTQSAKAQEQ